MSAPTPFAGIQGETVAHIGTGAEDGDEEDGSERLHKHQPQNELQRATIDQLLRLSPQTRVAQVSDGSSRGPADMTAASRRT